MPSYGGASSIIKYSFIYFCCEAATEIFYVRFEESSSRMRVRDTGVYYFMDVTCGYLLCFSTIYFFRPRFVFATKYWRQAGDRRKYNFQIFSTIFDN